MIQTTYPSRFARIVTGVMVAGLLAGVAGVATSAGDPKAGKPLFAKCLACHYPDGRAKMKGAPDLSSKAVQSKITDARMAEIILKGTPRMPGYKSQFNEKQAEDLTAYVRTLGK